MTLLPTSPSKKRPFSEDDAQDAIATPVKSTTGTSAASVAQSTPLSSVPSLSPAPDASNLPQPALSKGAPSATTDAAKPPQKRRKLTAQEKEQQRLEKEAKDKAREEQKAQREEERKAKEAAQKEKKEKQDEERRLKDEALKVKKEQLEEKRRAKELEQAKKDEEKAKKERSQMKLGAFFAKPKDAAQSSTKSPARALLEEQRRKSVSVEPENPSLAVRAASPSPAAAQKPRRCFFPFELQTHASLPKSWLARPTPEQSLARSEQLDAKIQQSQDSPADSSTLLKDLKPCIGSGVATTGDVPSVSKLMALMSGSSARPVDLTAEAEVGEEEALAWLQRVPLKLLRFHEDVRPPYCGTFSRPVPKSHARTLARNPLKRGLPEVNYDYDSEAEWEEPEEGEDLDSDGEEDAESNGDADEMDGFLDDEEDVDRRRQLVTNDLEPVNSGLVWEDSKGVSRGSNGTADVEFRDYKLGFLFETPHRSIDPFSTVYWAPEPKAHSHISGTSGSTSHSSTSAMQPPRLPLTVRPNISNTMNIPNATSKISKGANVPSTAAPKPVEGKRQVPPEHLEEFKKEIIGSDMTKIAMVEALKKKFPKFPKDMITNTLNAVAKRVGQGHEKTWQLS